MSIRTVRSEQQRNICLVSLKFDDGSEGLGESFYAASAVETYIHDEIAPILFATNDLSPESVGKALRPYVGYQGSGIETRANAAVDIALWDALAHRGGLSLSEMLGGPADVSVPVYNTCAGTRYVSDAAFQRVDNWGLEAASSYEDLQAFLTRPGELALELRDLGYMGMKVWPFDQAAERSAGLDVDRAGLRFGVKVISDIRDSVGDDIEIMVELHALWSPRAAEKILRALEPYDLYWAEDPLRADSVSALSSLRQTTTIPLAVGETVAGSRQFLRLLEANALDVATLDIGWVGGLTEALRVASLCETHAVPIAPHDCTGPVSLAVASHVTNSAPNGLVQETARAFLHTWYADIVDWLPTINDGMLEIVGRTGHGMRLAEDLNQKPGFSIRETQRN